MARVWGVCHRAKKTPVTVSFCFNTTYPPALPKTKEETSGKSLTNVFKVKVKFKVINTSMSHALVYRHSKFKCNNNVQDTASYKAVKFETKL